MLKYLIILLDDTSVSFCHYVNVKKGKRLITIDHLKEGILFAMKQNLMIQFVYPEYELPQEYKEIIHSVNHCKIVPHGSGERGDVLVLNGWDDFNKSIWESGLTYVLRTSKRDFFDRYAELKRVYGQISRLNIVMTDVDSFVAEDFEKYKVCLSVLAKELEKVYVEGLSFQLNLLTDRMMLSSMNNCNAGWEHITLAPDGNFYICPAFYLSDSEIEIENKATSIGDLCNGLRILNSQLYRLGNAPVCRNCDAFHCKRCVWLNRKTTLEVNTPGHEQCVVAHLERNASRDLLSDIRKHGIFITDNEITAIEYLDPFDARTKW